MAWRDYRTVALFLLGLSCIAPQTARAEEEPKKFVYRNLAVDPQPFPAIEEDNCGDETNWTASILHSLLKRACQVPMGNTGANSGGNFVIRSPCEDQGLVKYRQQIYCWTVEGPPAAAADYIAGLGSVEAEPLPCLLRGHTVLLVRQRVVCIQTPRELMRAIATNPRGSPPVALPPREGRPRRGTPVRPVLPPAQARPGAAV